VLAHFLRHKGRHVGVKAAQHPRRTLHLRDLRAQAVEDGREFAGDVAAAHDQQPFGKFRQVKHVV
jgi:hypothetical protein